MNTDFTEIAESHSDYDPAYPSDWPRPTPEELDAIERDLQVKFSEEFRHFQLEACHTTPMGDQAWEDFGWAEPSRGPRESLREVVKRAQSVGVPMEYAPFKCDNGDYFCCKPDGSIVIWDHNSMAEERDPDYRWGSFTKWLLATFEEDG